MNKVLAVAGVVVREMYRRKDFYVLFILTALITLATGSMRFFDDAQIVGYLKEICLLLIWLSSIVIAVSAAARQIPAERESRTIFPLLAKPVSRSQVLVGKFLGCWLACGVALLVFYLFFGLISASREHAFPVGQYFQAVWLHWICIGVLISMTLLGSLVFTAPSSNMTIVVIVTLGILFLGRHLHKVAVRMTEPSGTLLSILYYAMPHLELFDVRLLIVHGWPMIAWPAMLGATVYGAAYTAFFLVAACLVFRRKALN